MIILNQISYQLENNDQNVNSFNQPKNSFVNKTDFCDFTCLYTNADQFLNKRAELKRLVEIHNPSIIGITDVKPKNYR